MAHEQFDLIIQPGVVRFLRDFAQFLGLMALAYGPLVYFLVKVL